MVLGTAVDLSVLSYPMLVIMKEQGADVGRGGASPKTSGEAEPALSRRTRRSQCPDVGRGGVQPSGVGRGGANPSGPGEAQPTFGCMGKKCSCVLACSEASAFDGY